MNHSCKYTAQVVGEARNRIASGRGRWGGTDGVALVMVLGFLAIMTMMAVTFAISLRVERLVSRSHLDQIQSNMLLEMALARALAAIEQQVQTPYADQLFLVSEGIETGALDESAWDHIPAAINWEHGDVRALLTRWAQAGVGQPEDYWKEPQDAAWQNAPDDRGQYAFYVVDTSGFIDAHVPMAEPRGAGFHAGELSPLPQVGDDEDVFHEIRTQWLRLFDQNELAGALQQNQPNYLFPFSYAPPEWDTIPVVLDQANDGVYRYINVDGAEEEITVPTTSGWGWSDATQNRFRVPNWLSAYTHGDHVRLNVAGTHDGDLAYMMRTHWRDMLAHFRHDPALYPSTRDPSTGIQEPWDSLDILTWAMCDLFGQYNLGKGVIELCLTDRFRREVFAQQQSSGDWMRNYQGRFPYFQPGAYITQVWAMAQDHPEYDEDDMPIEPVTRIWVELEIEYTNPFSIPVDLRLMQPVFQIDIGRGLPVTGNWGWAVNRPVNRGDLPFPIYTIGGTRPDETHWLVFRNMAGDDDVRPATLAEAADSDFLPAGQHIRLNFGFLLDFGGLNVNAPGSQIHLWITRGHVGRVGEPEASYARYAFSRMNQGVGNHFRRLWYDGAPGRLRYEADDPRMMYGAIRTRPGAYAFVDNPGTPISYAWKDSPRLTDRHPGKDGTRTFYSVAQTDPGSLDSFPVLDSVAHIGRQPLTNLDSWRTIPLVGDDPLAVDVARYFVMRPESHTQRRGRININSPFESVLASGFLNANTDMTGTTTNELSQADAVALARLILDNRPRGGYTNTVDVWRSAHREDWESCFSTSTDKFQVEEVIARSMHLFTTRQQIYTIFLAGQQVAAGQPVSSARAMAVVWRDPFPTNEDGELDATGRHRLHVLSYRTL